MRVITFGIKSVEEMLGDFEAACEAAQKHLPCKPRKGIYFTSLDSVRNFLTPKRLELLHAIKEQNPGSVYALAKMTRRGFPSVLRDVELLRRHGLVKLTKAKKSPRRAVQPAVGYDAIHVYISI